MIQLQGLYKAYGSGNTFVQALKDINMRIAKGEFVAITGPSGSGKSTLMNILGCLDQADSGNYRIDGKSVEGLNSKELAVLRNQMIGFIFQSYNLLPALTVLENVEVPMTYCGICDRERKRRAQSLLEAVNLGERLNHRPNQLSGGQRQRVAIARALVNNPRILLADEPTGNLDSKTSKEIMTLFKKLNQEGMTIILITHDPAVALEANRQLVIRDGLLREA